MTALPRRRSGSIELGGSQGHDLREKKGAQPLAAGYGQVLVVGVPDPNVVDVGDVMPGGSSILLRSTTEAWPGSLATAARTSALYASVRLGGPCPRVNRSAGRSSERCMAGSGRPPWRPAGRGTSMTWPSSFCRWASNSGLPTWSSSRGNGGRGVPSVRGPDDHIGFVRADQRGPGRSPLWASLGGRRDRSHDVDVVRVKVASHDAPVVDGDPPGRGAVT